jgi:hypothetical protein
VDILPHTATVYGTLHLGRTEKRVLKVIVVLCSSAITYLPMHSWKLFALSAIAAALHLHITITDASLARGPVRKQASSAIGNWEELESSLNAHPDVATFTGLSSIARRADQLQVALPDGWSASVQQFSCFLPIPTSNFEQVEEFWTNIMVYGLTQMIQNNTPQDRVAFRYGLWSLKFLMSPRSSVQEFQWSFVYYFAQFMLRWAQRGFVGYGGLGFRHSSGVIFAVELRKAGG